MENVENFFQFKNGRYLADEGLSEKMYQIVKLHPERPNDKDSGFEWSEAGMAELFGEVYKKEARYCFEHKCWYVYESGKWQEDYGDLLVSGKLKEFMRLMILYCGEIDNYEVMQSYAKFINRIGDTRMRDRILKDAREVLRISANEFDSNPYLINCINGTYDLKTYHFYEHKWDDFLTMQTRFRFTLDRDVNCDRWLQFIDEVTEGDKEKADFLQRALGYSLLGMSNEECMFILHGKTTRNGKSTLLNTIQYMLGDYSTVSPVQLICKGDYCRSENNATPILAGLKGKRFVTMSESNEYGKLDEEKIKQLTGGEEVTARQLYQKAFSYKPQFTLWLSCNDLPSVTDKSLFASDRIKVIEFNKHFSADEQNKHLKDEFCKIENMKGIFMWLVRGYIRYRERGLIMSESLRRPVRQYEKDNDLVLQFLEARCERDESVNIKKRDLYKAFTQWARSEYAPILSARKFYAELERHSEWYDMESVYLGYPIYKGLKLKEVI